MYLDFTNPGGMTTTRPTGGNYIIIIGALKKIDVDGVITVGIIIQDNTAEAIVTSGFSSETEAFTTLSFDNATRIFTIEAADPVHTHFYYYLRGKEIDKFAPVTFQISNDHGVHLIYFNNGSLVETVNPTQVQIINAMENYCTVASVFWDSINQRTSFIGNYRHGIGMTGPMLSYIYLTGNTRFVMGLALNDFTLVNATFGVEVGSTMISDIIEPIKTLPASLGMPIGYITGNSWVFVTNPGYSFITTARILQYNKLVAGGITWSLADVALNDYTLIHLFASNHIGGLPVAIIGQNTYLSKADAQAAAETEITELAFGQIPIKQFIPIRTVILSRTPSGTQIQTTTEGYNYLDWRLHSFIL